MTMRELAVITFLSLDGVMQSPFSPDEDQAMLFSQGGWAAPYWDQVMPHVYAEAMSEPYDILFGRGTYDIFAAHWPNVSNDDPVAARLNGARKYVVTRSAQPHLEWAGSEVLWGVPETEVKRLKQRDGPLIQVHGSWRLLQMLIDEDLVDEYRLWTFPVLIGEGKRLFQRSVRPRNLRPVRSSATENGVVMSVYRRL